MDDTSYHCVTRCDVCFSRERQHCMSPRDTVTLKWWSTCVSTTPRSTCRIRCVHRLLFSVLINVCVNMDWKKCGTLSSSSLTFLYRLLYQFAFPSWKTWTRQKSIDARVQSQDFCQLVSYVAPLTIIFVLTIWSLYVLNHPPPPQGRSGTTADWQ